MSWSKEFLKRGEEFGCVYYPRTRYKKPEISEGKYYKIIKSGGIDLNDYYIMPDWQKERHDRHVTNIQIDRLQYGLKN